MTVCQSETFLARGSVVRVTLRIFISYANETFWPMPNFNVLVVANGSGKSGKWWKIDNDFSSYGIKIQVRFRQGQELQDLSKGTQSGGEKSVSTAVYMMALQEMTQVPFRCVDEINQGWS